MVSFKKIALRTLESILIGAALTFIAGCGGSGGGSGGGGNPPATAQCNNEKDDDGDTLTDMDDPGCSSPTDNSEYNSAANNPPVINSSSTTCSKPETGENITYDANATDKDGNLSSVTLETSTDGVNFVNHAMTSTGSDNYRAVLVFDDAVASARIRARDSKLLDSVLVLQNGSCNPIYLSEGDGTDAILNGEPDLKTEPSSTDIDTPQKFASNYSNIDVTFLFKSLKGILYNKTDSCDSLRIPFEYVSRTNELNSTQIADLEADLDTYPHCNSFLLKTPYRIFSNNTAGVPTTRADISDEVNSVLTAEDANTNYVPVAEAGPKIIVPKNTPFTIDATNSYDLDGTISLYELDLQGDGTYDGLNSTGIFNIAGYPLDACLTSKTRVTDNENATETDTASIQVGSGVCP